jgi:UDP-N-acetylglucosamine 2-epimerase (non-hydrolysing)
MSRVIAELDKHTTHTLVHTGQNYDYELNRIFFDDLQLREPDYYLDAVVGGVAPTIGNIIAKADDVMVREAPDAVLIYGDTNSGLAVIAAKRRKIPVFHFEAGNRCFDQRVPEELNRKVIDHLSDINFVLSEHARRYLLAEGVRPETVIKSGSHMQEVLEYYADKIERSKILQELSLRNNQYFLVSMHREENVDSDKNLKNILQSLKLLASTYNLPVVVSTHPRTRRRLGEVASDDLDGNIIFMKPFGFTDYIKLQQGACCIISDSGTISEEASLLNLPAINIRNAHERPEGMENGIFIMSGLTPNAVLGAVKVMLSQREHNLLSIQSVKDYEGGAVSTKILRVVMSYIPYIRRTTWHVTPE